MISATTVVWFFFILTWNGEMIIPKTFNNAADCEDARQIHISQGLVKAVREVSLCMGYPLQKPQVVPSSDSPLQKKHGV